MLVIGISGKKQSGKDTVALILQHLYPDLRFKRLAFANALKREVSDACKVPLAHIESFKDLYRPMLQWWGTDFRRHLFGEDYWVEKLQDEFYTFSKQMLYDVAVIPDVRFKNEADWICQVGTLIRVERNNTDDGHISETELDNYPFQHVIQNFGTKEELEERVKQLKLI